MKPYGSNYEYGNSYYKDEGLSPGPAIIGYFYFLPNWKYPVKLSYGFDTPISFTRRKLEQRKPLRRYPVRKLSFSVSDDQYRYETLWNYLISIHDTHITLPIYTEPCRVQGSGRLDGVSVVNVNDISNYYNLQNLAIQVAIIDIAHDFLIEIISISSLEDTVINLSTPITSVFQRETSYVFPVFECYLSNKEKIDVTDKMTVFNLEFTEYVNA